MDHHPGALCDQARHEGAIKAHGRQEVQRQFGLPFRLAQGCEAAAGGRGAPQHVNDDVGAAHPGLHRRGHGFAARRCGQIGSNEEILRQVGGPLARRRHDLCPQCAEERHGRRARALRSAGDQRALARQSDEIRHHPISRSEMRSPFNPKVKVRSAGLPGKSPVTFARTRVFPATSVVSIGSA